MSNVEISIIQKTGLLGSKPTQENEEVACPLPRPDFSQMIPYKPKPNPYPYEHPLAGGTFPQPPALAALCAQLPPPTCFRGPFVAVDSLIDIFNRIQLPEGKNLLFIRYFLNCSKNFIFIFFSTCTKCS